MFEDQNDDWPLRLRRMTPSQQDVRRQPEDARLSMGWEDVHIASWSLSLMTLLAASVLRKEAGCENV